MGFNSGFKGLTIIVDFILPVERIMNIEVTVVYFSTLYSHLEGHVQSFGRTCTVIWKDMYSHLEGHIQSFGRTCTVIWKDMYSHLEGHVQSFGRTCTVIWKDTLKNGTV